MGEIYVHVIPPPPPKTARMVAIGTAAFAAIAAILGYEVAAAVLAVVSAVTGAIDLYVTKDHYYIPPEAIGKDGKLRTGTLEAGKIEGGKM